MPRMLDSNAPVTALIVDDEAPMRDQLSLDQDVKLPRVKMFALPIWVARSRTPAWAPVTAEHNSRESAADRNIFISIETNDVK